MSLRKFWLFFLFAVVSAPLFAAAPINSIVAIVNKETVTGLEVENEARRLLVEKPDVPVTVVRQLALDRLIDRRLQLQLADRLGIEVSDRLLEKRIKELKVQFNTPGDENFAQFVEEYFFSSVAAFRRRVREDMRIQAVFFREVFRRTQVYEDEIEQFLQSETPVGVRPEYRLAHILVARSEAAEENEAQYQRAVLLQERAGAAHVDFAELAKAHSDGEYAAIGGDFGFRDDTRLPAVFVEEAQNMKIGEISPVIETARGYHILRLVDKRGGTLRDTIIRRRLRHIFLPLEDTDRAIQIYRDLQDGGDFEESVAAYSIDNLNTKGGDLGWFTEEDLPRYFVEAVVTMSVGAISEPVESPFGWHILSLTEREVNDFDIQGLRDQARRILREKRALAQRDVWLRRLRSNAYVRILDSDFVVRRGQ